MANIGKTQNKGVEVSLNGVILDNVNGITWEVGANVYANRNKLVALNSGQQKDEGNWWFVGHSINVIFDYKYAGLWQASDPYFNILEPGGKEGMIRVKYDGEYNPDGSPVRALGADDREVTDMDPNWQGGFNTRIAYKGLELSVIGSFQNGGVLISQLYGPGGYLNNLNTRNGNNVRVDYWTPTNTGARWPAPNGPGGDNPKYESTLSYFNGTYLRIRNITLGYNIPVKFLKGIGIDKLRIYGMVQNPFVFFSQYKNISGMDPETNSYANQNASVPYSYNLRRLVTIGTNTPTTRNYVFGINLTF
jgi:hypothetical protein